MITRRQLPHLKSLLKQSPAVALLGPRQAGKTTLAHEVAAKTRSTYLDLERHADRAKLRDPEEFLAPLEDQLDILDEVQRAPELFQTLRGMIDETAHARIRRMEEGGGAHWSLLSSVIV